MLYEFLKRLTLLGVCGLPDPFEDAPTMGKNYWDKKSYKKGLSGGGSGGALGRVRSEEKKKNRS